MAIEQTTNGTPCMVCDCDRAGPDWDACDLPVVPLKCDGRCERKVIQVDTEKRERFRKYLEGGGTPWTRGCGEGHKRPLTLKELSRKAEAS